MQLDEPGSGIIDKITFREALGAFATGVTIVTTRDTAGRPIGLTASSFNSVSLEPPLVLWSLALDSPNLPAFREAPYWAVHVLSASQKALSSRFASRGIDKFAGLAFADGLGGVPLFDECAARFLCRATFEHEGGDHAIFVGEVLELVRAPAPPLLFHGGQYARMMPPTAPPPAIEPGDTGGFNRHFLGHLLLRAYNEAFDDVRRAYQRHGLRSADYSVLAALGLGDGCTLEELVSRVSAAGLDLAQEPVNRLVQGGKVTVENDRLCFTEAGKALVMELVAVAQESQKRLESRLSREDAGVLLHLLDKLSGE